MHAIRAVRLHRKLSQVELAARLGCSPNRISDWERGRFRPDLKSLIRLADALACTLDQLVGRSSFPEALPPGWPAPALPPSDAT